MSGYTVSGTYQIYVQTCCNCGVAFGVPDSFDDKRRDDGKTFYCPNGHGQSYGNTLSKRLQQERDRSARLAANLDQARAAREAADRRAAAARGQVTKIKKRIGRGVCPCCNRSFEALAEHMKTEHPEYAESGASE